LISPKISKSRRVSVFMMSALLSDAVNNRQHAAASSAA